MKIALVCIARNEENYIEEWIKYNLKLGFDDIFIYEHNWKCDVERYNVHKIEFNGTDFQENIQRKAYNHFIRTQYDKYDWAAFFDVDEFLVLKAHNNIKQFIANYKDENAVCINWVCFGDNGLSFDGNYSVLSRFTKRSRTAHNVHKCILKLNPNVIYATHNPINCEIVDTHFNKCSGATNEYRKIDIAQLNHYYCKTIEEYQKKIERNTSKDAVDSWYNTYGYNNKDLYFYENNANEIVDTLALDFYTNQSDRELASSSILSYKKLKGGDTPLIKKQTNISNDNSNHFYDKIDGWFNFENIYALVVRKFNDGSKFVEIGSWKGKSASYMGIEIKNSGKKIQFDCIDTWDGSEEHTNINSMFYDPLTKIKDGLFDVFMKNIYPVSDYINPIRMTSVEASKLYEDESLDFIFIDAAHDYENVKKDILAWFPKLKKNGIIAGHDYTTHEGVKLAVDDLLHVDVSGTSWVYENREIKNKKFSIIIPTYQRTELLYRALQSVRNQDYDNYEVFVCSDGYSEADEKCVIGLKDERFKYHHINPVDFKNYGNIQRNEMLKLCTGDYVFYLDDDNDVASDYLSFANRNLRNDVGMMISKVRLRHVGENVIVPYVKEIKQGFIDTLNLMVKTDVAKKYQWRMLYEADYHFIKDCETHCLQNQIPILYVNKIIGNHN
jgi:hypothetical protein